MKTMTPNLTAMSENNDKEHREIRKKVSKWAVCYGYIHTLLGFYLYQFRRHTILLITKLKLFSFAIIFCSFSFCFFSFDILWYLFLPYFLFMFLSSSDNSLYLFLAWSFNFFYHFYNTLWLNLVSHLYSFDNKFFHSLYI